MTVLERMRGPTQLNNASLYDWDELVHEDRVHRLIYTDPAVFDAEMNHIFGGTWVYLAHESQIPNPNDFVTGKLGLRPLIITRDSEGVIRALFQSLHTSRHDALSLDQRQYAFIPVPLPWLEFSQYRQAAGRALA